MSDPLADRLTAAGIPVRREEPLGPLCTYRVGGPARWFVPVGSEDELLTVARLLSGADVDLPVLVVGRGSNLLVADAGFPGVVLQLGEGLARVELPAPSGADALVVAGGAAPLPVVARRTAAAGLTGFEWAVGVPGSIGGAVRMNAGGHGSDMAGSLVSVRVVSLATGEDVEMAASDLELGYRTSSLAAGDVVASATLRLTPGDASAAEREVADIVAWRREHQPGGANAGSVFTNPEGDSAGRLIDAAGGRGLRHGSAEVSTKHANFIQSDPGGSADDVAALMVEVQDLVADRFGVLLHAETVMVGEFRGGVPR